MKDVLIINSYAGSLTLGTMSAGYPIRGSYEDSGFGIEAQMLNFPDLNFVPKLPWPTDDLSETVVMSHPPCAAFSNQNSNKDKRGTNTGAFDCHRRVMEYAFSMNAAALSIESVPGAIQAAGEYAATADKYGYDHCFIELNSISFGVPQWRPRIWTLFFRRDLQLPMFKAWFQPRYVPLQDVLQNQHTEQLDLDWSVKALQKAREQIGNFDDFMASEELGAFLQAYGRFTGESLAGDWQRVKQLVGGGYNSAMLPKKLSRLGFAPVILYLSQFFVDGRPLSRVEYQRCMGFPDGFKWPAKMQKDFRLYLSKGVCPPVARFIVGQLWRNVTEKERADNTHACAWGEVLNLEPKKNDVLSHLAQPQTHAAPQQWYTYRPTLTPASVTLPSITTAEIIERESVPDATGCSESCEQAPAKPKIVAKLVGFVNAPPENGQTFTYRDGVLTRFELGSFVEFPARKDVVTMKSGSENIVKRTQVRASSDELKTRAAGGYNLAAGVKSSDWSELSHAYAIVRAIELLDNCPTDRFSPNRQEIIDEIERSNLIKTTMPVKSAVSWMLNKLVEKGKVVLQ